MKDRNHINLDEAISAVRSDELHDEHVKQAQGRVWSAMSGVDAAAAVEQIRGCEDVRAVLPAYNAGSLAAAKTLIVRDHLRECVDCARRARLETARDTNWAAPLPAAEFRFGWPQLATAAGVLALIVVAVLVVSYQFFAAPEGFRAKLQSAEGAVYRVSEGGERLVTVGEQIGEGERLRTAPGAHAFVELRDGSVVEMNGGAEFAVKMTRRNTTVDLDKGNIIVQAAKRRTGHLYVATRDADVSVTGTVFAVTSGTKGSRVSVVEGEVHVEHGGSEDVLHSGDQVATGGAIGVVPVVDEIAWSRNREKHLALLAEFSKLRTRLAGIAEPAPRFSSHIFQRVPANTLLYVGVPNMGEMLSEADRIFREQLAQSPALQEWWAQSHKDGEQADFERMINNLRELSGYVGDEVVLALVREGTAHEPSPVMLAQVTRTGIADFLRTEFGTGKNAHDFAMLDEHALMTATPAMYKGKLLAFVGDEMVAFSPNVTTLQSAVKNWKAATGEFANTGLGQRVAQAYGRGAGFLLAADLGSIITTKPQKKMSANARREQASLRSSGIGDVRYLVAEHREIDGKADNRAVLEFAGERRGIASWLAAPAPMRSLEFVSRNAGLVASFVPKSPALMFDDMMAMAAADGAKARDEIAKSESELGVSLRDDLAAAFGSDVTFALDGPVLPTPAWRLVAEVNDPERLQNSLARVIEHGNAKARTRGKQGMKMERQQDGNRVFFSVRSLDASVAKEMHYTFVDGYMVAGPTRALVLASLRTRANGDSLARSADFRATLPADNQANCSGLLYQNLSPLLQPLGSVVNAEQLEALNMLARDSRPSTICAYGEPNAITLASNSRLLELNPLTLPLMFATEHRTAPARKQR